MANWRDQHVSTARVVSQSSRLRVNADVSVVTTLQSMGRSMPDEVVGVHPVNWQNDSVVASSVSVEGTGSERFPWLPAADFEDMIVDSVVVSDGCQMGNDTHIAFVSGGRRGVEHAVDNAGAVETGPAAAELPDASAGSRAETDGGERGTCVL